MKDEHKIIRQVYAAKEDMAEADALIRTYMPFIRAETARWLKRPPAEGQDDELSIAMIAFHEAVRGYSRTKGAFFKYAAMLIRSRLIDYHRREERHRGSLSLDEPEGESGETLGEKLSEDRDHSEELAVREAARAEIAELTRQMQAFGVGLEMWRRTVPDSRGPWRPAKRRFPLPGRIRSFWRNFFGLKGFPFQDLRQAQGWRKRRWSGTAPIWRPSC